MAAAPRGSRPATTAGSRPEYRAVPWRFTRLMRVRGGRDRGRITQRRSTSTWLWPPPASTSW